MFADVGQVPRPLEASAPWNAAWFYMAGAVGAIAGWLSRVGCGLSGHTMMRHYEPSRMSLRCLQCGAQTSGWTI